MAAAQISNGTTLVRLSLKPDDVLLVRVAAEDCPLNVGKRIKEKLNEQGVKNLLLVAHEGSTVEQLDPETMARHGWYRKATKR